MKSEKAKNVLENSAKYVKKHRAIQGCQPIDVYVLLQNAELAVELAEQEAEERMQTKAMEAFCAANCPKGCSFGADGNIGCGAKARFIQKLAE